MNHVIIILCSIEGDQIAEITKLNWKYFEEDEDDKIGEKWKGSCDWVSGK